MDARLISKFVDSTDSKNLSNLYHTLLWMQEFGIAQIVK